MFEAESEIERESMPVDVLFVGGGPACLAGALHLMDLIEKHNEGVAAGTIEGEEYDEPMIGLIEKGSEIGSHGISGAVLDPRALDELIPDWKDDSSFPLERYVEREAMLMLADEERGFPLPFMPPEFHDHGKPIVSIAKFQKWLGEKAEEKGVMVFPGFAGVELLYDEDGKCNGVRTGDKGVGPNGEQKDNFEPGMDLESPVTILGEGPRGHLARILMNKYGLQEGRNEMGYETGCKEVLEFPEGTIKDGFVYLLAGYPLQNIFGKGPFGGGFIYSMGGDRVCIGLLATLDAEDPGMDVHYLLQKTKMHPKVREILAGGKVIKYGAKAVTVGGWGCMPKLYAPGAMIVGDSASFLNAARIKGIHLAMKSGMLAAETAFEAMKSGDNSETAMAKFKEAIDASWVREEMEPTKNFHAGFANNGMVGGTIKFGLSKIFGSGEIEKLHADHEGMKKVSEFHASGKLPEQSAPGKYPDLEYDGTYIIDKLTDVYLSATKHDEHQPCHLKVADTEICATKCAEEYGNPCERFCPAQVYNMVMNEEAGRKELQVDFSNCVHCKTCDIRDPYQIIQWVPPEGGDGPEYGIL
ncbi:MAG: electron transfer flavoprotein-ubiquinone oxidoreductase [Proteobacteria bacterium]|nr:electron transfer flavoprotein-ubiquinone oxidoreductase [Pseudomonadota bacterium]MCP4916273.1 electron transfer flavoprotein-ubiquinone oxidoreductase [Pseudomonadota bacterium]